MEVLALRRIQRHCLNDAALLAEALGIPQHAKAFEDAFAVVKKNTKRKPKKVGA